MSLSKLLLTLKGGSGSGNHGHAGIPGHRGGSAPSVGNIQTLISPDRIDELTKLMVEIQSSDTGKSETNRLLNKIGYAEKPNVIKEDKLDDFIKDGGREMFRAEAGVNSKKHIDQFRYGDLHTGSGSYATGIYAAHGEGSKAHARHFNDREVHGTLTRMVLDKSAKVVHRNKLMDDLEEFKNSSSKKSQELLQKVISSPTDKSALDRYSSYSANTGRLYRFFEQDLSRFASLMGYDAIEGIDGKGGPETLILNRRKVHVSSSNLEEK